MPVRAKLCGIRSERDLQIAIGAGADAVGLICGITHVSEDALDADVAKALSQRTPPFISRVLVTHLESGAEILELAAHIGADTIQLHGLVDIQTVGEVFSGAADRKVTKAIHVTGPEAVEEARRYLDLCDALHLDSRTADRLGGTGMLHDWSISRKIVELAAAAGRPVILSGGLTPENVTDAIATVRPYAVDVNSGVEDHCGDKSADRASAFVSAAHAARIDAGAPA